MHSAKSSFLAGDDCVFVREVGKETDEPVMVCDQGRLSIFSENPVGNQMLFLFNPSLACCWPKNVNSVSLASCSSSCFSRMN